MADGTPMASAPIAKPAAIALDGAGRIAEIGAARRPNVVVLKKRVTPDNFNQILRSHQCVGDIDFMSIDIDSYDYWLWKAITASQPITR